jgi:uncharacterized protein with von Willebrand factor type A (vWA) domain
MDQRIVQFIAALRAGGVRVSLAESEDAFHAIEQLGVQDRDTFRLSLRATLIKDSKDLPRFEKLFPLFFQPGEIPPLLNPGQDLTPEEAQMLAQALRQYSGQLRNILDKLAKGEPLTQQEIQQLDQLVNMDEVTDLRYQNWLTRQMEQVLHFKEVRQAMQELMDLLRQMGMNRKRLDSLMKAMQANQEALHEQLHQHVGQRIAENMSRQTPHELMDGLYNRPFRTLSEEDLQQLHREVQRLAAILRTRLALRMKRARSGQLDAKATLRTNLKNGSVPIEIRHRNHALKPRIVVLCDISTSMRACSELMLSMLYAIQDQISKTFAFAFIDDLKYISPYFEGRQPSEAVGAVLHDMPSGYYNTDLGSCLNAFTHDYLDTVDRKSTFIIVGDARNNYNDPNLEVFRNITRRSRSTIWLNPEAIPLWGTGDSDMLKYAPLCQRTFQVSNLAQLAEAVDHLLIAP